jgi:hypothetical protein
LRSKIISFWILHSESLVIGYFGWSKWEAGEATEGPKEQFSFVQWHDLVCSMLGQYKVVGLFWTQKNWAQNGSVKRKKISLSTLMTLFYPLIF